MNFFCYETKAIINIYYGTKFQHYAISGTWVIINFNKLENFTEPSVSERSPNQTLPSWGKWRDFQAIYGFCQVCDFLRILPWNIITIWNIMTIVKKQKENKVKD